MPDTTPRLRTLAGKKRHMFGWRRDLPDHRDLLYQIILPGKRLPVSVDLRSGCTRIENQFHIGSCTANASTSAMEFLAKKLGRPCPDLSRLFVYFATRVWVAGGKPTEDTGATIRDVMKALATYGACLEDVWPYETPRFTQTPSAKARTDARNRQITVYYRCPNLKAIKQSLAEGHPVTGGFAVPSSIDGYETERTGIVAYPSATEKFVGGHAVLFVGYDDRTRRLTFQNSWGANWGDKGFGYLPYDYVENWLANDFWTIRQEE